MYSFNNDYSEGAHPKILEAMMNCNLVQNGGCPFYHRRNPDKFNYHRGCASSMAGCYRYR